MDTIGDAGKALLNELGRQVMAGLSPGETLVEARLGDEHIAGLKDLSNADGYLMIACAYLDETRPQLPRSLRHVRIHWPSGLGVDLISMHVAD